MNQRRGMAVVCGLCLAFAMLRAEWTWNLPESIFWLRIATTTVPLGILLVAGFFAGAFHQRVEPRRLFLLLLIAFIFGAIVFSHRVAPSGVTAQVRPDFYVGLVQMAVCAAIGYWMARDARDARWLLSRCALCFALVSVYGGIVRLLGVGESFPYLVPGYPVRLFIIFGHCWYLYRWLTSTRWSIGALLGIVACSPEILITFHKPILFCTLVPSLFIFVYSLWATRRLYAVVARSILLIVLGVSALCVADWASSHRVTEQVEATFRARFLHERAAARYESLGETLERLSGGRFHLWRVAVSRFAESPVVGSGFGQKFGGAAGERWRVHVHNGYLDLLIAAGIVGTLPVFAGVIWWFTLVSRPSVTSRMGALTIPCIAFIVSVVAYNIVGCSRSFPALNSFTIFIMALLVGLADQALATTRQPNRRYHRLGRFPSRRRIRYANGRS